MRGGDSSQSEEERAFLQLRVGRFGLFSGLLFLGFLVFRLVKEAFGPDPFDLFEPSNSLHALASVSLLAIWGLTYRGSKSARFVRSVETIGLLLSTVSILAMAQYIPLRARPELIVLLALIHAAIVRAIYVPSSARRTFLICLAMGAEIVAATHLMWLRVDIELFKQLDPSKPDVTPQLVAVGMSLYAAAWWVMTTATATAASRVIYGLRRAVSDARQLGQYRIESKLGEGGMGVVYRARHALLRRPTAVKLLQPHKTSLASVARFEREVRLMAKLRHPNTVTVFDFGHTPDGTFYYAMELLEGATLQEVVQKTGPMEPNRVVQVMEQVAAALVEAHGVGLIHRDIKPSNVMLHLPHRHGGIPEVAKVLDFGLVKDTSAEATNLTRANVVSGTPQYMSPESIQNPDGVDVRSDLYSLGCVGYLMLTGHDVFEGQSVMEVCAQHLRDAPADPQSRIDRELPSDLVQVIMRCLQKTPSARFQDAVSLQHALAQCQNFGSFTAHDAEEWWSEYGFLFENKEAEVTNEDLLTVNLGRSFRPESS